MTLSDAMLQATFECRNYLVLPLGVEEAKAEGGPHVEVHYAHGKLERWNWRTRCYEPWIPTPEELSSDGWVILRSIPTKKTPPPG